MLLVAVEHWDRTTGFRFNYIALLLEAQGRRIEVINETETDTEDELVDNFVALITSIAARIHGYRVSKRWAEQMCQGVEDAYS